METGRPIVDLVGKKFGKLTGIRFDHQGNGGLAFFEFLCDCGTVKILCGTEVSNGRTLSCGCYRQEVNTRLKLLPGEAAAHMLYKSYQYGAKSRGLEFTLEKMEFLKLTKLRCKYCGSIPEKVYKGTGRKCSPYVYNGIDRIDNNIGYITTNVCPCCEICNQAKHAMPLDKFLKWIKRLVEFQVRESDASSVGEN